MTKLLSATCAAAFVFAVNGAIAQNVKSDQDKAQGQEQKMQEKEQGTSGAVVDLGHGALNAGHHYGDLHRRTAHLAKRAT